MNEIIVAVAGAGKTEEVASRIADEADPGKVLVLTYTERNQSEDICRILSHLDDDKTAPDVMGWFSFLLNEIVRPYLPLLYPGQRLRGLCMRDLGSYRGVGGTARYFNNGGDAYPGNLSKLAVDVIAKAGDASINRLEMIYDAVYIDEAQDLCGNDLVIVESLMKSAMKVIMLGDPRQSVIRTSKRDTKYKPYRGVQVMGLYSKFSQKKICRVESRNETHRFIPEIANFSDKIFASNLGFAPTVSSIKPESNHFGIYLISKDDISRYASKFGATVLRHDVRAGAFPGFEVANFGECKGMQRVHVVVIATGPIEEFLGGGSMLADESACGFYVAVTRATSSVALAVSDPNSLIKKMRQPNSRFAEIDIDIFD